MSFAFRIPLTLVAIFALFPLQALAFRGEQLVEYETPIETPASHLPGYFDTYTVPKGKVVLQLPYPTIEYGITDRLSLGTTPGVVSYGTETGFGFSSGLKSRYLFYSNSKFASALTAYGGMYWNPSFTFNKSDLNFQALTSNTSWYLNSYTALGFHLSMIRMGVGSDGAIYFVAPGFGIQKFFSDSLGFEAQVLFPIYSHLLVDSSRASIDLSILNGESYVIPHRLAFNFRTGKNAILSAGVLGFYLPAKSNYIPAPSLTFTFLI